MIRQSKKEDIIKLLFETSNFSRKSFTTALEDDLKNLQNEVNLLKSKLEKLETSISRTYKNSEHKLKKIWRTKNCQFKYRLHDE